MSKLYKLLPELKELDEIESSSNGLIRRKVLAKVDTASERYPIEAIIIGPDDPTLPVVGLFGGVHGLERIGTQVVLSYLKTLAQSLKWDQDLRELFTKVRLVSIPIINPYGIAHHHRSNANGVDLMRNAPVDADVEDSTFLVSGHRVSNKLPWYRGEDGAGLEVESQCLLDFLKKEVFPSSCAITLDVHSGFGMKDQLWHPWGYTKKEKFTYYDDFVSLQKLFEETYPNHVYKIEPQADNYLIHGDLWDYALLEYLKRPNGTYLPLTLELGSWIWVKKNPFQLFSIFGLFNPVKEHRFRRVMRRHVYFINFLLRAVRNKNYWQVSKVNE